MNKPLKKTLTVLGIILGSITGLFLLLYFILFLIGCGMYGDARAARRYVCDIPEINSGYAPQGIAYAADANAYILTGYDTDGSVALYIVQGKKHKRVRLKNPDGKTLTGHAGGVACTKDFVYIANDYAVNVLSLAELLAADGKTAVTVKQSVPVDNRAAYCHSDDEYLYVGEFYRKGNYETEKSHYYTTPNKANNKAVVSCYKLDPDGSIGDVGVQPYPEYCISVTGLVQGFAVKDGICVLSRSYGLRNSELQYHSAPKSNSATISVTFKKNKDAAPKTVPLFYLDNTTNYKTLTLPAFSEDITVVGDRVVVTNEASTNKYFIGKLFNAAKVYSYPIYRSK